MVKEKKKSFSVFSSVASSLYMSLLLHWTDLKFLFFISSDIILHNYLQLPFGNVKVVL